MDEVKFNPAVLDGRGTRGLAVPKSNWANKLDAPPFEASAITCGITFTFGGLRINGHSQVLAPDEQPIPRLHPAGGVVGDLFFLTLAVWTGLLSCCVFGCLSGNQPD